MPVFKILKTMVAFDIQDGMTHEVDTIEHEGKFWLVPNWLERRSEGWQSPTRIIWLGSLPHQKVVHPVFAFLLKGPLSKAVFDGTYESPVKAQYVVVEAPNIRWPMPPAHMN